VCLNQIGHDRVSPIVPYDFSVARALHKPFDTLSVIKQTEYLLMTSNWISRDASLIPVAAYSKTCLVEAGALEMKFSHEARIFARVSMLTSQGQMPYT
jgi:hypothetical protein